MEIEEFERASKDKDFAIGDSFWINDIEFEVMSKRKPTISLNEKKESKFRESLRKVKHQIPELKKQQSYMKETIGSNANAMQIKTTFIEKL